MPDAAASFHRHASLLRAGGTNRLQRTLPGMEAGYIQCDERGLSDLLAYAAAAAEQLRFHSVSGHAVGDWGALFDDLRDGGTGAILDDAGLARLMASENAMAPQLALLLGFFEAFGHLQQDFNRLPARHLTHYFGNVLGLGRRAAAPDRAHVIFTPASTTTAHRLKAGTVLDAGTDAAGQPLKYKLERETIVTQASLSRIERQVVALDRQGRARLFRAGALPKTGSWPTFGSDPFTAGPVDQSMTEIDPGFAVADPVLRMAEGVRTVTLTLALTAQAAMSAQVLTALVRVDLTGEEGWLVPETASVQLSDGPTGPQMTVKASLGEDQPAVVDYDAKLHAGTAAPAARWPVLRCRVRSDSGRAGLFAGLTARAVDLTVEVDGVADLIVQNDQRVLDTGKPMPVFTPTPGIGANFYIGCREAFAKRLTRLSLDFTWQDLPDDLLTHYAEYFDFRDGVLTTAFRPSFTAVVDLLDGRSWAQRLTGPAGVLRLFGPVGGSQHVSYSDAAIASAFGSRPRVAMPDLAQAERYEPGTRRGFLRLKLTGPTNDDLSTFGVPYALEVPFNAFGHEAFAKRYAKAAVALARYDASAPGAGPEPRLPNAPYTPMLSGLRLGYGARSGFAPGDVQSPGRFYTLGAQGYTTGGGTSPARCAPDMSPKAELLLGFKDFDAPGTVSVLFQVDEGTATVAEPPAPGDIAWSYLSGDRWVALPPSALVVDETRRFQTPGIVAVAVGAGATTTHTAMPAGLTWLRATLSGAAGAAARTLKAEAQAATVVFAPEGDLGDYAAHLQAGLPKGTIARLDPRQAAIKAVAQPYPSFGGRAPECDRDFFERSAERLRHRDRAVTTWDFEHRLLEAFPGIFKLRALAHSDAEAEAAVGEVALVVIPNLRLSQSSNRLEPRAGETLMQEIRDFTDDGIATPFARINVIHPVYERVRVRARVAFRAGFDPGYYSEQLGTDLQRFLSPWAFEEGRDINFGTRIYRSELLKFVEDRDYVDYVTRFDVYHAFDGRPRSGIGFMEIGTDFVVAADPQPALAAMVIGEDFIVGRPVEAAASTRPHAVLVSHPQHLIEPVFAGTESCQGVARLGIGYMIVGLDFTVAGS